MEKIEGILKEEVDRFISLGSNKNGGTITAMSNRVNYVKENLKKVENTLIEIANKYLIENPDTDKVEITKIVKMNLDRFIKNIT